MEDDGDGRAHAQLQRANVVAAGGDWRARFPLVTRRGVVIMISETLKKHLPVSELQGMRLSDIQEKAVRFEDMMYTAATSQSDYWQRIALQRLSMENQTKIQQTPINAQVIPDQNCPDPASGLLPQGNPGQSSASPLMARQASSLPSLGQSFPGFSQTSTLQNMSGMPQNTMIHGFTVAQDNPQDIDDGQRQLARRKQEQVQGNNQLLQQQQKMLLMQQQQQKMLLMQQQQQLLHPIRMTPTLQPMMQMLSGLQSGQCTTTPQQTQQPNIILHQQLQQLKQQSIFQHGSMSGALQQEDFIMSSTLPMQVKSSRNRMSTVQPDNANSMQENASSLEQLRQKQEEYIRRHQMQREMQRQLLQKQISAQLQKQLSAQQQSQKQQQVTMEVTQLHSENDVNNLKDIYMVASLLLFIGVLVAMSFMVYNGWWDLWQV